MSDEQDMAEALDEDVVDVDDDRTGDGEGLPDYPPDRPLGVGTVGVTAVEEDAGESFEERTWREDPDPGFEPTPANDGGVGQLIDPDVSTLDHEEQQVAEEAPSRGLERRGSGDAHRARLTRSGLAGDLLGVEQRALLRSRASLPVGGERRDARLLEGGQHERIVVDDDVEPAAGRQLTDQFELDPGGRSPVVGRAHHELVSAEPVGLQPGRRGGAQPAGAAGEEDDLVLLGEALDDGDALRVDRVVGGRVEEGVPVLRAAVEVVQAVADIGDDAVDVDDRQRSRRHPLDVAAVVAATAATAAAAAASASTLRTDSATGPSSLASRA